MINCYFYLSCPLLSVQCSIVVDCYLSNLYVHVYVTEFIFCQLHLCAVSLHLSHVIGHLTSLFSRVMEFIFGSFTSLALSVGSFTSLSLLLLTTSPLSRTRVDLWQPHLSLSHVGSFKRFPHTAGISQAGYIILLFHSRYTVNNVDRQSCFMTMHEEKMACNQL